MIFTCEIAITCESPPKRIITLRAIGFTDLRFHVAIKKINYIHMKQIKRKLLIKMLALSLAIVGATVVLLIIFLNQ